MLLVQLGGVRQLLSGGFGKQSAQLLWILKHQPECDSQNFDLQNLKCSVLLPDILYLEFSMPFLTKI